jgi:LmbE family N-acetylglucosaminyl deacetylase
MKELLRRGLRAALTAFLRLRSSPYPVSPGGRCVVIAPHQDDEALGCAGIILANRAAQVPVTVIYVTDGAGSHPGHPHLAATDLARLRRAEARQAMGLLGVPAASLQFLDAPDGTLGHLSPGAFETLARRLAEAIAAAQPTELFLPCREDGSSEHCAAFAHAGAAPRRPESPAAGVSHLGALAAPTPGPAGSQPRANLAPVLPAECRPQARGYRLLCFPNPAHATLDPLRATRGLCHVL